MLGKSIVVTALLSVVAAQNQRAPFNYGVLKEVTRGSFAGAGNEGYIIAAAADDEPVPQDANSTTNPSSATPSSNEPCAQVNAALAALPKGARPLVNADLGLACLRSVPVDQEGNIQLIKELKLYAAWQSNLAYLKNPPPDYTEAPVDIMAELDGVSRQLEQGMYTNEYDVQFDLMELFNRAYDNHLFWNADIITGVMQFQRMPGTELISVSRDGTSLPDVYVYNDIKKMANDSTFNPSPVRTINSEGVETYLEKVALQADFHDADARYNALFPNQAFLSTNRTFLGSFRSGNYDGPVTKLSFENGTSITNVNVAVVFNNFTGVTDGKSFFKKFCSGPKPTAAPTGANGTNATMTMSMPTASPTAAPTNVRQIGYPSPVIMHPQRAIGGYHIKADGYDDVAVLSIPTFQSTDVNLFQDIARNFINMSVAMGKKKLIFDFRGNGGGNAILGYDTFKQVFPQPDQEPFGATQFRAHDALNIAGQMTADFDRNTSFREKDPQTYSDILALNAGFNFQRNLNMKNEKFESWEQMFGPIQRNEDLFSSLLRYNFSDPVSDSYFGFSLNGMMQNGTNSTLFQPFKTENMIMLQDGMCSSTCAIAAELLKNQGGVKTVVMGGRPKKAPMQGIGGTKGAQSFLLDDIQFRMQTIYQLGTAQQQALWNTTTFGQTVFSTQIFKRADSLDGSAAGGVNLKDNIRRDDSTMTPLEFLREAADCRIFYTPAMVNDVTNVWKAAADGGFNGKGCVDGSMKDPTSVSGGGQRAEGTLMMKGSKSAGVKLDGGRGWLLAMVLAVVGYLVF